MQLLIENIKLAISAIKSNKMRSFLTMLGIIIGISSVIAISSIGASAQGAISKEFEGYSSGYMYIGINWQTVDEVTEDMMLTPDDIEALRHRFPDDILYAAPSVGIDSVTKVGRVEGTLSINGVAADYTRFSKSIHIIHGRMINQNDVDGARNNIVIPVDAAKKFFGKEDVVGEILPAEIRGNSVDLTIVGVYEIPPSIFSRMDTSTSYTCYAADSTVMQGGYDSVRYIEIFATEDKDIDKLATSFVSYLEKYKGVAKDTYSYESLEQEVGMINTVLGYLSVAIGAIAAISLLVGGIGIMNIMLVSVTERTREIGIRKSLGARTKDILTQFLIEAIILSVIGGVLGTTLGIGIAALGALVVGVDVVIRPSAVLLAVGFSAAVGLAFGYFPARKAARLDPIEALRYE